jgi:outer membrane protein assembly factor BamB
VKESRTDGLSATRRSRTQSTAQSFLTAMCVAGLALACTASLFPSDWPRFRGPNGTGVSADRGLPAEVDRDENVLWWAKTPKGNSSPIVVGGRVFFTAHEGDERIVLCYDAATGKLIWRRSTTKARAETFSPLNGPTTPTPASDGRNIFVFFPECGLLSYDRDGAERWRTPLGPFAAIQGLAASPVYVDGKIALLVDTPEEAYLAAFEADTGEQVWRTERPTGVLGSYATPTLYESDGDPTQIVVAGAVELTSYGSSSGKRLWWVQRVMVFPTAPPFVSGDSVYTVEPVDQGWPPFGKVLALFDSDQDGRVAVADAAGDIVWARSLTGIDMNKGDGDGIVTREEYANASSGIVGGGLTRTRVDGKGDVSASHVVWRHGKGMPSLAGALLYQDLLYVIRNAVVSTFDPETGELRRRERVRSAIGDYYASPVAGDGKIYLVSLRGRVTVLKAGDDWQTLSTGDLGEQVIATPAIADGRLYIRTEGTLYCFGATGN